ncbi:helix-turn-helix domain-containing protein [Aeromonas veronii]|uniref:helix-turn-helix domain-containing protein n=1 Tax=Aeromonas veronii TaxID=654 RepID=UPI000F5F2D4C|nr:helix-turn-helix domain-containing protein [Aeromonas veronii]RRA91577.1 helix-turn-helix domain-containing protein [Aeromonas veronii bv. sobria]
MNQKKNESSFFRAFDEIYKIKKIKGYTFNLNHKSVYCFLLNYQMMSGKVFPSYKHIQDNLGIGSDNTVKKYLDELEEMGLVKTTSRKGTSKLYELVTLEGFNALDTEEQQTRKQPNKNLHIKSVVKLVGQSEPKGPEPVSKQDDLPDPFLDDCGISHDDMFEEFIQAKPTKHSHHHEPGRLCDKCFRDRNGEWDCSDEFCQNCIPF